MAKRKPKLSKLIREGAKKLPKAKTVCFYFNPEHEAIGSCTLGAAYHGAGFEPVMDSDLVYNWFYANYPKIGVAAIYEANDALNMSREEIADILEAGGL